MTALSRTERDVAHDLVLSALACVLAFVEVGAAEDHNTKSATMKRGLLLEGIADGYAGTWIPHPDPGVPPIRRRYEPSFDAGTQIGQTLRRIADHARAQGYLSDAEWETYGKPKEATK